MRVYRKDCLPCSTAQYYVQLTYDEAVMLAEEIRKQVGAWPGPFARMLTQRLEKVTTGARG